MLTMEIIFHIPNSLNSYHINFNNTKNSSSLQLIPVPLSYQCKKNYLYTQCAQSHKLIILLNALVS